MWDPAVVHLLPFNALNLKPRNNTFEAQQSELKPRIIVQGLDGILFYLILIFGNFINFFLP